MFEKAFQVYDINTLVVKVWLLNQGSNSVFILLGCFMYCLLLSLLLYLSVIKRIYDGVEAETRKSQAGFQII